MASDELRKEIESLTTTTPGSEICKACGEPKSQLTRQFGPPLRVPIDCACQRAWREQRERADTEQHRTLMARRCKEIRRRWEMEEDWFVRETFEGWDHSGQPSMTDLWHKCRTFATYLPRKLDESRFRGVFLIGGTGTGKSRLLNAIANYTSRVSCIPAISVETRQMLDWLKPRNKETDDIREALWQDLISVPLLCLHDITAIPGTKWELDRLFALIETRLRRSCTCIADNDSPYQWAESADTIARKRIVSRLDQACRWVVVPEAAQDYRHYERKSLQDEDWSS